MRRFLFRVKIRYNEADRERTETERNFQKQGKRGEYKETNKEAERNGEWETDPGYLAYTEVSMRFPVREVSRVRRFRFRIKSRSKEEDRGDQERNRLRERDARQRNKKAAVRKGGARI